MELYLQIGWGMRGHSHALADRWGGATAILSPRDMEPDVLRTFRDRFIDNDGRLLLDPQFFDPEADFHRLHEHNYWPSDYAAGEFWEESQGYGDLVTDILALNDDLGCYRYILPGTTLERINDDAWFTRQGSIQKVAQSEVEDEDELIATVALGPSVLQNRADVHSLLRQSQHWSVGGIYIITELPPGDDFYATDAGWLSNLLDLIAGYRLRGFDVILGHVNQQMLATAVAAPTAIASGTKKNVRYFEMDRYYETEGGGGARPIWCYVPQALSEYRVSDLVTAQDEGVLDRLAPPHYLGDDSLAGQLFQDRVLDGTLEPTAVGFATGTGVRHYLDSLRAQIEQISSRDLDTTATNVISLCRSAGNLADELSQIGIVARESWSSDDPRQTDPCTATIEAVRAYMKSRGPLVRKMWDQVHP